MNKIIFDEEDKEIMNLTVNQMINIQGFNNVKHNIRPKENTIERRIFDKYVIIAHLSEDIILLKNERDDNL